MFPKPFNSSPRSQTTGSKSTANSNDRPKHESGKEKNTIFSPIKPGVAELCYFVNQFTEKNNNTTHEAEPALINDPKSKSDTPCDTSNHSNQSNDFFSNSSSPIKIVPQSQRKDQETRQFSDYDTESEANIPTYKNTNTNRSSSCYGVENSSTNASISIKAETSAISNPTIDKSEILTNIIDTKYAKNLEELINLIKFLKASSFGGELDPKVDNIEACTIEKFNVLCKQNGTVKMPINRSTALVMIGLIVVICPDLIENDNTYGQKIDENLLKAFLNLVAGNLPDKVKDQIMLYSNNMRFTSNNNGLILTSHSKFNSPYQLIIPKQAMESQEYDDKKFAELVKANFDPYEIIFDGVNEQKKNTKSGNQIGFIQQNLDKLSLGNMDVKQIVMSYLGAKMQAEKTSSWLDDKFSRDKYNDNKNEAIAARIQYIESVSSAQNSEKNKLIHAGKYIEIRKHCVSEAENYGAMIRKHVHKFDELEVVNVNDLTTNVFAPDGKLSYQQKVVLSGSVFAGKRISNEVDKESPKQLQDKHLQQEFGAIFDSIIPDSLSNEKKVKKCVLDLRFLSISGMEKMVSAVTDKKSEIEILDEHCTAGIAAARQRDLQYCCFSVNVGNDLQVIPLEKRIADGKSSAIATLRYFVDNYFFSALQKNRNLHTYKLNNNYIKAISYIQRIEALDFKKRLTAIPLLFYVQELNRLVPDIEIITGCKSAKDRTLSIALGACCLSQLVESRRNSNDKTQQLDDITFGLIKPNGELNFNELIWREVDLLNDCLRHGLGAAWSINQESGLVSTNINSAPLIDFIEQFPKIDHKKYLKCLYLAKIGS